mmetsp:Transcript_77701/g.107464  ORF Transcript_77701/g.107464 Transcript_77701/m.107464 type:complete len:137 (-) Transcript_77701:102-512(-)
MYITQNLDGLDCQTINKSKILSNSRKKIGSNNYAFTDNIHEIHGNFYYMHCSDEEQDHSKQFYKGPLTANENKATGGVPVCKECGANMKPHVMFFDEKYSEHYYRSETVKDYLENCDCLVVVGATLETGLSKSIVN